jgi:hypothetical protein
METLVLEINNATNYRILLALAEQLEGVSVATKNTAIVAEDSEPYQTAAPKKVRNMEKYWGCLQPNEPIETIDAKLATMRQEWERSF